MNNNYVNTISKIKANDELKRKIVENMKQERMKKLNKGGFLMKLKRIIIAISSIIGILIGSGAVYAALGGTIAGKPALEWLGIKFSKEYSEYVEQVENMFVENENMRMDLLSTVSDDGFIVLDFDLTLKENFKNKLRSEIKGNDNNIKDEELDKLLNESISAISFNDKFEARESEDENGKKSKTEPEWWYINSSYDSIIIDNKEFIVRGRSAQEIKCIVSGEKYHFYQLYFLTNNELNDKEDFKLTLKSPVIQYEGEKYEVINGEFNIALSKEKAMKNTTTITDNNAKINYKTLEQKIDKVTITPMQNIVKLTTTLNDVTEESWTDLSNKNYVGDIEYKIYNDKERINGFVLDTGIEVNYSDGSKENLTPGEYETKKKLNGAKIVTTTYMVIEKNDKINDLKVESYVGNEYTEEIRQIGYYKINLNEKTIKAKNQDKLLDINYTRFRDEEEAFKQGITLEELRGVPVSSGEGYESLINEETENATVKKEDSKENIVLYRGYELNPKTGIQNLTDMKNSRKNQNRYNTNYYVYNKDGSSQKVKGIFGEEETYEGYSVVQYDFDGVIALTENYNPIPRKYKEIKKLPKELSDMSDYSSVNIQAIDLDGDNKTEYIVCYTLDYKEGQIGDGTPEASSGIILFDSNYNKIADLAQLQEGFLWNEKTEENKIFLDLEDLIYADIDNDGIMEIIIELPSYEGFNVSVVKYNKGNIEGETNIDIDKYLKP